MFKNIFFRLLFTYLTIMVLVISVLTTLLAQFFNFFYFEHKQSELLTAGNQVRRLVDAYKAGEIGRDELTLAVNAVGSVSGSRILVLEGENAARLRLLDERLARNVAGDFAADIARILEGETVTRKKQYSSQLNTYVVLVGMPIFFKGKINGLILLFSPLYQINGTILRVYRLIWVTALISLAAAAVIIFLTARRISRPIVEMRRAAVAIADGDFSREVITGGRDEVAELGRSFNYMKNRLKQVEQMRRDLIANVSHELRTPLTTIRGFIQGILEGVIKPEQQEKYLRLAFEETGRLTRLVKDLLELAKLQAGSITLQHEPLNVVEVLKDAVEEFRLLADQRGIKFILDFSPDTITISGDRDRQKQIFLNILSNALKYTNDGGNIWIRAAIELDKAVVRIRDDGIGIPEEDMPYIFEKFHRVDKSRDAASGGTGLGLAIVKQLVELHGGTISALSKPGEGTEIIINYNLFTF